MNTKAVLPLALLLVTPFDPSLLSSDSCLSKSFYGNYQQGGTTLSVLRPDNSCLDTVSSQTLTPSASIVEATREIQQLVWLEEQAVDHSLVAQTRSFRNEFDAFLDTLSTHGSSRSNGIPVPDQEIMGDSHNPGFELLYRTPKAAMLSVSHEQAMIIDTLVPRFWKSTLLPTEPVSFHPVTSSTLGHAENVLAKLKFDPLIAAIVGNISVTQMKNDIRFLSGEDGKSGIVSRHSFSSGAITAADWLKARFEETGATCELKLFLVGFAPNVVWYVHETALSQILHTDACPAAIHLSSTLPRPSYSVHIMIAVVPSETRAPLVPMMMGLGPQHSCPLLELSGGRESSSTVTLNLSRLQEKSRVYLDQEHTLVSFPGQIDRLNLTFYRR